MYINGDLKIDGENGKTLNYMAARPRFDALFEGELSCTLGQSQTYVFSDYSLHPADYDFWLCRIVADDPSNDSGTWVVMKPVWSKSCTEIVNRNYYSNSYYFIARLNYNGWSAINIDYSTGDFSKITLTKVIGVRIGA